jgi:hypothetical protein
MGKIQERIVQLTHALPEKYQEEVLDFIEYIYTKAAWKSDTEYLSSVPGMKEKIIEASKTPLRECDTKLDW